MDYDTGFILLGVISILCIGGIFIAGIGDKLDTSPEYEIEMDDGVSYQCHSYRSYDSGITRLYNVNDTREVIEVITSHIVHINKI